MTMRKNHADVPRKPSFRKPHGQQVEGHHGAARVGDHGGEPPEHPVRAGFEAPDARGAGSVLLGGHLGARPPSPHGDPGHEEQDRTDRGAYCGVVGPHHEDGARHDAHGDGGKEPQQGRPMGVTAVDEHGERVARDQDREQHTGRFACREHGGEDGEADRVGTADGGLGEADERGCRRERGQLPECDGVHCGSDGRHIFLCTDHRSVFRAHRDPPPRYAATAHGNVQTNTAQR